MKKYIILTIISVITSFFIFILCSQFFYSDYRKDAIAKSWAQKIQQHLISRKFDDLVIDDLYLANKLLVNNNFVLVIGLNNSTMLLFYQNKDLEWSCASNTKLKKMGDYYCD